MGLLLKKLTEERKKYAWIPGECSYCAEWCEVALYAPDLRLCFQHFMVLMETGDEGLRSKLRLFRERALRKATLDAWEKADW